MCSISCVINGDSYEASIMGNAVKHRGTKHKLTSINENVHVYFSQLSITDQDAPMQPFVTGEYTVWLNGYISNYKELAEKYKIKLATNCDTELLSLFINKFKFKKLNELNGFFAVAVWDGEEMHCFTDRYSIKQLYQYRKKGTTYICSEVKGILALHTPELDPAAVEDWHYSLGIMTDDTIYKGIKRVPSLPFKKPATIDISYEGAKIKLVELLKQSFERNKITTLKTGVLLSGGVDSGIIAKWMKPDYAFSMDYEDDNYSEYSNIKLNSVGIHHTLICNRELVKRYAEKTLDALDDVKCGSCYTNFAITELASRFCTVIYSGAGGDELFDGYTHRYDRPVDEVVRRNVEDNLKHYDLTHKEYDWRFLKGILVVEDRMSGHFTLECRYPFLDNDLVNFVLSLPSEYKVNKKILKEVSGLAPEVTNGKKRGFSNPYFENSEWAKLCMCRIC